MRSNYTPSRMVVTVSGDVKFDRLVRLCEKYFANTGIEAACRVHGGGFAGTVQVFLPTGEAPGFTAFMSEVFGEGSCHILKVRRAGAVRVF